MQPLLEGEASSPKAAPQPAGDVGEANLERSPSLEEAAVAGAAGVAAAGAAAAAAANADNGGEAHDADSGAAPAAAEAAQQGGSGATAGAAASGAEVLPTGQAAAGEARALSEAMDKQQLASALDAEQRQEALAGSSTEAEGLAVAEELAEPIAASVAAEAEAPAAKEAQEGDSAWDRSQPSSAAEQPPLAATRAGDDPAEPEAAAQVGHLSLQSALGCPLGFTGHACEPPLLWELPALHRFYYKAALNATLRGFVAAGTRHCEWQWEKRSGCSGSGNS